MFEKITFSKVIGTLGLFALVACTTPYTEVGDNGGYDDYQVDKNLWNVSFAGNDHTSFDKAFDLNLLRAATLVDEAGFTFFTVQNNPNLPNVTTILKTGKKSTKEYTVNTRVTGYKKKPNKTGTIYVAKDVIKKMSAKYLDKPVTKK